MCSRSPGNFCRQAKRQSSEGRTPYQWMSMSTLLARIETALLDMTDHGDSKGGDSQSEMKSLKGR